MLPNRRLIIASATLGGLFILYGCATLWAGIKTEETLQEQHKMLAELPLFKVKSHTYERGWLSSTETTELVFNRKLSGPYENMLPDNVKPLLNNTIKFTNHIQHGPLPGITSFNFRPGRALVRTEFSMSDSTRKTLSSFFGDKEPITITNHLGFGGGGVLNVNVPAFDYEEALSGVKMKWQGFSFNLDYAKGYKEYKSEALSPGFLLEAASKGSVTFNGVRYISDIRPGNSGIGLGTSELSIDNIQLSSREHIPYSIKLSELIYLMTRVRIGEFINPSGELKPSTVTLKKFSYQTVTSEQDEFSNARGKINFAEFTLNDNRYGPMRLDVSASHIHSPSFIKLKNAINQIPFEGVDPVVLRKQYIDTIKKNIVPLLENNPKLLINDFFLKTPSGDITLQGSLGIKGLIPSDLNNISALSKRLEIDAKVSLPRQTLENLVVMQARSLFAVDESAEEQPNMREVESLIKSLLDSQLSQWKDEQYIEEEQGQLRTSLLYRAGILQVNRKRVTLPWEEEEIEAISPSQSSAPVSSK
ncbi:YdgA family protein [Neisseriaceae bacterium TC5R-5]|nr:YdgA family protein [Neisseriaceae bacterium TC5R-5]